MEGHRPRLAVVVDDSPLQCAVWRRLLKNRFGVRVEVETYTDPVEAIEHLGPHIHLLLMDKEMSGMDCREFFESTRANGVNPKRIIITSSQPADQLHEDCDKTGCLAVIEKSEPAQHAAFLMILDSIMKR